MRPILLHIRPRQTMLSSILLVLATGWFSACSQDDINTDNPDGTEMAISFGGEIGEDEQTMGTRATQLGTLTTSFKLWGYKNTGFTDPDYTGLQQVFPGYTMTYDEASKGTTSDNTHGWSYVGGSQYIKYWDKTASAYRFMAYAPADAAVTQSATADALTFSFTADATSETAINATPFVSHLWFSNNNYPDYPEYGKAVQMSFIRPFTRARFMFIGEDGQPLETGDALVGAIDAATISFKPADTSAKIAQSGTMQVTYPITGESLAESFAVAPSASLDAMTEPYEETVLIASTAQKWYTVLPNNTQGAFRMELTVGGEQRSATVPAQFMQWKAGYAYTYVFKLSGGEVQFESQLFVYDKWQAGYSESTTW